MMARPLPGEAAPGQRSLPLYAVQMLQRNEVIDNVQHEPGNAVPTAGERMDGM